VYPAYRRICRFLICVLFSTWSLSFANEATDFAQAIKLKTLELEKLGKLVVGDRTIYGHLFVNGLYELNGNRPLWNKASRDAFFSAMDSLNEDGLDPTEYAFPEIATYLEREQQVPLTPAGRLELDLLFSEGLIRALYNLAFDKVDPVALDSDINFAQPLYGADLAPLLVKHITEGNIAFLLDKARPEQSAYANLKQGLDQYREIQASGGWPTIPEGKTLKHGERDARVSLLAERLSITGDYRQSGVPVDDMLFDSKLVHALKQFQTRHGLEPDGTLGAKTMAALNVPVEQRIDQIRVNLERHRWYLHELEGEFIIVDIAGFKFYWFKDGEIVWEKIVQVGKEYTKTPVFKDEIEYIDFNPTWTIPPGILKRSILPKLKKDPAYLDKKGFKLLTHDGKPVEPESVDWSSLKGFPYLVQQPPGPNNALGLVKFMFPNPHYVFLHDTNHRELFDRHRRTFSSGCIRVKDPFDLAERLLQGKEGWDRGKIDDVVASGVTTRVNLDRPMRIIIAYATARARDGEVIFREDVYKRDQKVLEALNGEFKIRERDL
jgi:murein L,D-transpeptidase YcbB/YkuD